MTALGLTNITIGSMNGDLGAAGANNDRRVQRYVIGGDGKFDAFDTNWTWNAYAQVGITKAHEQVSDAPQKSHLYNLGMDAVTGPNGQIMCRSTLTDPSNGCVPYNPFGIGVNSQAAIRYALGSGGVDFRDERFVQRVYSLSFNGEPFSTWAGPVSLAFGGEHRKESAAGITDAIGQTGDWLYGNYKPLNASNHVTEGFIETVIPLAKDQAWAKSLDLNAAIRGTDYSTSGYVTTWKVGATWDVIDGVRLRGTRSRDIRAPNLVELFSLGGGGFPGYTNPFRGGVAEIGVQSTTGNPALVPEKSDMTGLGIVLQPTFVQGFSVSADYWNMDINGAIGSLGTQAIIDNCYAGNAVLCQGLVFGPGNVITLIKNEPFNLVKQVYRGIDLEASYRTPLDAIVEGWDGNLAARFLATNFIKAWSSNGINVPVDYAGTNSGGNALPDWRWNADLMYSNDKFSVDLAARGISSGVYNNSYIACTSGCPVSNVNNRTYDTNHIAGAIYFDTSFTYKFGIGDTATEAFFNVRNIANKNPAIVGADPPGGYTYEQSPTNPQLYDVLGRVFRAGFRFKM
jgi:outer membrane receptor protein involved in Fe transport